MVLMVFIEDAVDAQDLLIVITEGLQLLVVALTVEGWLPLYGRGGHRV